VLDSCNKLHPKNIEGTSTPTTSDGDSGQGLRAKSIDDSLDILLSGSDCAVVAVSSVDSGRSSCESSLLCSPCHSLSHQLLPSSVNLPVSVQSVPAAMSTSSSFNDLQPSCFSNDEGPFFSYF